MATSTGLLAAGFAAKKLVENVVSDLYELAKTEGGFLIKNLKNKKHSETIYKKIWAIRLVKTIWQTEREIDLSTFYHPSKVLVKHKRTAINQIADLEYDGNILLEGTVGQGKSILLRYLASSDFCLNRRIPVFIELRRLRSNTSLMSLIMQELSTLGFDMTEEAFHFFAERGKILLLLDAFDETKEELREDLISHMESLIRRHDKLNVMMTSRPDSGAATSPFLRVFRVCELANREYEEVIQKMAQDKNTADSIIQGIRKDSASISQLLTTPLMVALLMVRYRVDQSLPQNRSAFYESLFLLLLQRHDKGKGGYVRPRKSAVSDILLHDFFNSLSFVTRKAGDTSFTQGQLVTYSRHAVEIINLDEDVENLIRDIIEITCLVVKDGEESKFIHKSVQEYHAALFIKEQPDDTSISFYTAMRKHWSQWTQELRFLNQIDRYRYLKYFYIEALKAALGIESSSNEWRNNNVPFVLSADKAIQVFGDDQLTFSDKPSKSAQSLSLGSCMKHWPLMKHINGSTYVRGLFSISPINLEEFPIKQKPQLLVLSIEELIQSQKCRERIIAACADYYSFLLQELNHSVDYIEQIERRKSAFDF